MKSTKSVDVDAALDGLFVHRGEVLRVEKRIVVHKKRGHGKEVEGCDLM